MKTPLLLAASAFALTVHAPASAQSMHGMHMPGMTHAAPKPVAKKSTKTTAKKTVVKKPAGTKGVARKATTKKAVARKAAPPPPAPAAPEHEHVPGMAMPASQPSPNVDAGHSAMDTAVPAMNHAAPAAPVPDHSAMPGMNHGAPATPADHSAMPEMDHATMVGHAMKGALGPYAGNREASGTAWQPDNSMMHGIMKQAGDWMLMGHANLSLVADTQSGPRGDDKLFAAGMVMGMAQRPLGNGTLQFKAMLSPDPLMGKAGYPLLLASGETADGVNRLIDRQHPHDLFMELSGSISQNIGRNGSVFLYGGLPGEPAFGPPAFMHREAIADSPEAPISHHWLDSTHISFGVLTAGVVLGNAKLEVSRFNAREPDQYRYNIETAPLDSTAVRASWNPSRSLSLQGSYGYFKDPEQLEPGVNQKRWSASALYAREIAPGTRLSATLAWGRKTVDGESNDAYVAEAGLARGPWTVFARAEMTENSELVEVEEDGHHGPAYRVGKASLGVLRDFRIAPNLALGIGGLVSVNAVPTALAPLYGGRHPTGAMGFVRLKLM